MYIILYSFRFNQKSVKSATNYIIALYYIANKYTYILFAEAIIL